MAEGHVEIVDWPCDQTAHADHRKTSDRKIAADERTCAQSRACADDGWHGPFIRRARTERHQFRLSSARVTVVRKDAACRNHHTIFQCYGAADIDKSIDLHKIADLNVIADVTFFSNDAVVSDMSVAPDVDAIPDRGIGADLDALLDQRSGMDVRVHAATEITSRSMAPCTARGSSREAR